MNTVTASQLKATCLALLDEVDRTGEPVTVTKRGRPVAKILPAGNALDEPALAGTVEICGDIVSPVLPARAWDAEAPEAR